MCSSRNEAFYIASYDLKWVTTSWTYSMLILVILFFWQTTWQSFISLLYSACISYATGRLYLLAGVSDEFQDSPPDREYNTAKLSLHANFLESRLETSTKNEKIKRKIRRWSQNIHSQMAKIDALYRQIIYFLRRWIPPIWQPWRCLEIYNLGLYTSFS